MENNLETLIYDHTILAMDSLRDMILNMEEDLPEYELLMNHLIYGLRYFQRKRKSKE